MSNKISFVIPWYGENIPGGAENACKDTAEHLKTAGVDVEVLTTCSRQFQSDWKNHLPEGEETIKDVTVKRFKVDHRDAKSFDRLNYKLMHNITLTSEEEESFMKNMINSRKMMEYIRDHTDRKYIFMPYMFGTTYYGSQIRPQDSYIIPCMHDEIYAYMNIYKPMMVSASKIIFLSKAEMKLAQRLYGERQGYELAGMGIDTDMESDSMRFRTKYGIKNEYILYVGRKDTTKNTHTLIEYFKKYKTQTKNNIKLILIGTGEIKHNSKDIIDLGYLPEQDKKDAYSGATLLVQTSLNESFSIVMMEAWICQTPALVHAGCEVTMQHCIESNAGLYFNNYLEFRECIDYILKNPRTAKKMGKNGKNYVVQNYSWEKTVEKYKKIIG